MTDRTQRLPGASPPRDRGAHDELSCASLGDGGELALKSLLENWRVPEAPRAALRARLVVSYRQQFAPRKEQEMEGFGVTKNFGAGLALAGDAREFHLTILEEDSLPRRLAAEVAVLARDARLTREELRRDPRGFARRLVVAYALVARRALARENVGYGLTASLAVVLAAAFAVVALDRTGARGLLGEREREDLAFTGWVRDVPREQPKPEATGAGMAAAGHCGGQKAKYEKPGGGGGGGRLEDKPAVTGKLPQATLAQQVVAPDPHPPAIKNPSLPTPATIQADPVLFPTDTRPLNYGDPKSKATELSSGTGTGNGIGEGTGSGVGSGNGTGYGPGEGYNTGGDQAKIGGGGPGGGGGSSDYGKIFSAKEVSRRAVIIARPEPLYTEEARKNQLTGTIVLRLVLNANGTVTNIVALSRLPDGLTEKAIEAARRIQFTPAEREGHRVSQYATINYNFNIY